jgi:hypothetical protein
LVTAVMEKLQICAASSTFFSLSVTIKMLYVVDTQAIRFQSTILSAESSINDPKSPQSKTFSEQNRVFVY